MSARRVLIMGAAGRDFHDFNVRYRDHPEFEVVGFTATQIPNITDRRYPAQLAGPRYPDGIPIYEEDRIEELIGRLSVDLVVFAYSDVSHEHVMHKGSQVIAAGADFVLMGFNETSLKSVKPVVSVCAVRTGAGKSQTTRRVCRKLLDRGRRVVAVRHPMPYGDLVKQAVQRFAAFEDLDRYECTIEEREEYEPHLKNGTVVYAGVDYGAILKEAEREADVIVWDGGNNDLPFYKPDVEIVVVDPHRPGHELRYHPGEANLRRASCIVINKIDTADKRGIEEVKANIARYNPRALVIEGASPVTVEDPTAIRGKRVLVVEDGPTLTHGEMGYGAGVIAAQRFGAASLVDPRPYAVGSIAATFRKYPGIGPLLPAVGYGEKQMDELKQTIEKVDCDLVLIATPIDLRRTIRFERPALRVTYELQEIGKPDLDDALDRLPFGS
ncbi:MAG TPA: cyclic 2,3-diphosphoglycerate synthase [Candidatus Polarisedimenticolia bacterium]|jgi:predicted GTPase|nr:cyclic 2,3-diphosphoglycerate synthase [Candidatus Polarisedimenticolia bacterium]